MENSSCCPPNQDANSNCCTTPLPVEDSPKKGVKKNIGMFLMGLALVFAISSAFKTATNSYDTSGIPLSIEDFEWMETDKEVAYVLLKGAEKEQNKALSTQIEEVVLELNDTDGSAEYYELNSTHQHYANFMEEAGVEEVPTVVILGRGGKLSLFSSESISSLKLLRAYISASTPVAVCNPAACNPSKTCTPAQKAKCGMKKSN